MAGAIEVCRVIDASPTKNFILGRRNSYRMDRQTRRAVLGAAGGCVLGLAGCLGTGNEEEATGAEGTGDGTEGDGTAEAAAWRNVEMTDVTAGERFAISELERPTLVHPFAIWCSTCSSQNREIDSLQGETNHEVVQLNIGDGENGDDVRQYAEDNGYADHSRFAVAPNSVTSALAEEFGPAAVSPPQSPIILLCADGSTHEIEKIADPGTIENGIESNCG